MLEKEEVLKVAKLARIRLKDDEIIRYQKSLKDLIDEIDKIREIEVPNTFFLTPVEHQSILRNDDEIKVIDKEDLMKNVSSRKGSFVKTPVIINE